MPAGQRKRWIGDGGIEAQKIALKLTRKRAFPFQGHALVNDWRHAVGTGMDKGMSGD